MFITSSRLFVVFAAEATFIKFGIELADTLELNTLLWEYLILFFYVIGGRLAERLPDFCPLSALIG